MEKENILPIDGSYGEGGGQIIRNALALSMLTGQGIKVTNIRAHRKNPGLRPQHLASLNAAATISGAEVEGGGIGSTEITFQPSDIRPGSYSFNIGTAGSVTLLLQAILPTLMCAQSKSEVEVIGGTDVAWSPPVDYFSNVLLPILREMKANVEIVSMTRGFYPKGGGVVKVAINPSELKPLECIPETYVSVSDNHMQRGDQYGDMRVKGIAHVCDLPDHIAHRMRKSAESSLIEWLGPNIDVDIDVVRSDGFGQGTGITLWTLGDQCRRLGASFRGERGVKAETVGKRAANELITEIRGGCGVDIHLADQLPVFAPMIPDVGIGNGLHYTVREISGHLKTGLWLLEQFGHGTNTLFDEGFHIMV